MSKAAFIPKAPSLDILDASQPNAFITPLKKINEGQDVSAFLTSKAHGDIMTFLLQLNRAMFPCLVQNPETQQPSIQTWELVSSKNIHISEQVQELANLIKALDSMIDEVPPDPGPRRFGNASFRKWHDLVETRTKDLLVRHLHSTVTLFSSSTPTTATSELTSYFLGSFGSPQRLDYGSGHELSFLAFLGSIWKLGGLLPQPSDETSPLPPGNTERSIVLVIITPYLHLIRRLIKTYTLEPAGSHGVWGLDDHSFIPYILGSAQYGPPISPTSQTPTEDSLLTAPNPSDIANPKAVNTQRSKNLFFGAIGFIHDVKTGPFWEHSPILYDISGVRDGWAKINKGMIKMYNAEVLSKFPVVQHFRFGSLFSWEQDPTATAPPVSEHTSSQPIRDGQGSGWESASARGGPVGGTRTPWASQSAASPGIGIGTAAPWANKPLSSPTPRPSTAAPRTSKPPPTSNNGPPTRASHLSLRGIPGPAARAQSPSQEPSSGDSSATGSSMPPPTRAPWAK